MADKIKEGITIEFEGNSIKFDNTVDGMNKAIKLLGKDIKKLNQELKLDPNNADKLSKVFQDVQKQIDATNKKIALYKKEIAELTKDGMPTDKEGIAKFEKLSKGLLDAEANLVKLEQKAASLQGLLEKLNVKPLSDSLKEAGESLEKVGSGIEKAGKMLAPLSAGAGGVLAGATKAAMDFESALAGVYKTVEETPTTSYKDIERTIRGMATELPSAATEIASVMEMAGQLGVKADDLEKFTKVMIDLGNATNIDATEGAATVAQFYNIINGDLDTVDRFGAAITDLGNNSATTEADILNMAKALAATGYNIKISEKDILGLATALSSVGLKTERGGSSLSQVLKKIDIEVATNGELIENWAKVAGMSAEEFSNAWRGDTINAIKAIIKGLSDTSSEGENLNVVLQDLDVKTIRQNDTMQRLANAYNRVDEYVSLANKAWQENSALAVEVNRRYATTESQMAMVKNQIIELGISLGEAILPVMKDIINNIKPLVENVNAFVKANKEAIVKVLALTASLSPFLLVLGKGVKTMGSVAIAAGNMAKVFETSATATSAVAKILAGAGTAGLVGAAAAAVIGVGALVVAYKNATDETRIYVKEQENLRNSLTETSTLADQEYTARERNIYSAGAYAEKLDELAHRYQITNDIGGDTSRILDEMYSYIGNVNQALGDEVVGFDEATGKLTVYGDATDNAKQSVKELQETLLQKAWLETHEKTWVEAQQAQQEALGKMADATAKFGEEMASFGDKNYGGLKIPQEVIDNITAFADNGEISLNDLRQAVTNFVQDNNIQLDSLEMSFEDIVNYMYDDLSNAYYGWNTQLKETDETLAQAQANLDNYNAVLNAQPGEITAIINSLGLQGTALDNNNSSLEEQIKYLELLQQRYKEQHGVANETIQAEIDKRKEQMLVEAAQSQARDEQINRNKENALTAEREIDAEKKQNSNRNTEYEQKARDENTKTYETKTQNDNDYTNKVAIPNTITRGDEEKRVSDEVAAKQKENSDSVKKTRTDNDNAYTDSAKKNAASLADTQIAESARSASSVTTNIAGAYNAAFGQAKRDFRAMMNEMNSAQLAPKTLTINGVYNAPAGMPAGSFNMATNMSKGMTPQVKSGGYGDLNLETKIYVNGNPDMNSIRAWGRQIAEVVNVELGRKVAR